MSGARGENTGVWDRAPRATLAVLLGIRVLAAALLIADAHANPVEDPDVQRAERIVTSPATPYRDFPVEYMPLETAILFVVAGDGFEATATRIVVLSFVADLAAAAAVAFGWGRRPALVYLALGLPMLRVRLPAVRLRAGRARGVGDGARCGGVGTTRRRG